MPAVGDIRARIMALADRSLEGNPETVELLGYRLPKDAGPEALHRELASLASGAHPLVAAIPEPMNEVVTQHLSAFRSLMPVDMDLAGASIGNLILTSGYLSLDRQLEPVVRVFSGMVQARGVVMPVADSCAPRTHTGDPSDSRDPEASSANEDSLSSLPFEVSEPSPLRPSCNRTTPSSASTAGSSLWGCAPESDV